LVGSFFPKKRISNFNFNIKMFFGTFFMHVFKFNSSKFYTLHYWFWYLISNSKTCGSNLKIKSNLKIRFKMKAYYGKPKMFSHSIIFQGYHDWTSTNHVIIMNNDQYFCILC
jgi:hypothetical protein